MGFFYNGRLWISPAVMSAVNDSAMFNPNLSVGNVLAVIGPSAGGQPNTALRFGSAADAAAALRSGDLLDAITRAFDPSSDVAGPSTVIAVRVNPATQAALSLLNASAQAVISLASTDYGLYTNQIKAKIEAGSVSGFKLTTQLGNSYYSQDNVARQAFSVQYTGAQLTATMTVGATSVSLAAPAGTTLATFDLNVYKTVQQLVDAINTTSGFTATVLGGNGGTAALNGLDGVTAQDVKTALYTATANLQAVVDWFNGQSEGFVTATRVAGATTVPALLPWTYLAGGSDGVTTNTQWAAAFTTLQTVDAQWIVPASSDPSIHAMADAHCSFMSTVGRMERRAIVGPAIGTTDAQALTLTQAINSDRTSLTHLGIYDYDANGNWTLYPPYIAAAIIAGAFAGANPGTPLTNKSLKVRGVERNLRNPTDTDPLITGGVLCIESTSRGFRVVQSITTWLNNKNYNRVEVSTGVALDFTVRNVRNALEDLRGAKGTPITLAQAVARTETALRQLAVPDPVGPGVLAGDATNPPYKGITASLAGDVLAVSFQCSPVIPVNYIPVTVFAVPYSGTATA